ncbi:MobA/MobL family protein [Stenotrophomonas maltophilia]|uniref:MobA/MobL family protein n=1 Tax=Stenotrophomonas maltophilia TaxID=40324 RepID=UPI0018D38D0B|nr:MobA/MobL family protein [Stenotrophomonas maltophilia]MBH1431470.1 MobA/MobL family protein [Stenotrophomonas maltophilia]MBH1525337.1 MobA/MobL family protein [Stenotrophomonas maltophilia]MBH1817283.1 MobA/MobL family protein [Stenotrophomonas maltophilia]MBH1889869.1 MobA/MobL family protein [Stenotrophomonas maltophilia]MCU1030423.1 MobA/MobL family protein [Stenotrophomonas maltophilia]
MAIYHLTAKAYSRSGGHSSTAGAAYRAGVRIEDALTGTVHDYTRRQGVAFSALCLPGEQTADRAEFWNRVEAHHKRGDAITCREVEVALPAELSAEKRQELAHGFARHLAERYGVAADVAIHEPSKGGDERNHHAHILLSACSVNPDGSLGKKAVALDPIACKRAKQPTFAETEREFWATSVNRMLASEGVAARVDHRSLLSQQADAVQKDDFATAAKLDRPATKHEGKAVTQARRRGERLPRARRNDRVRQAADSRVTAHAERFEALKAQAAAEGRLAHVDEQALHAQALLERRKESAVRLRAASQPSPTEVPRHDSISPSRQPRRKRRPRAPALTRNNLDACRVRKPGTGNERVPPLRPLNGLNAGLASGGRPAAESAGFSRVLWPDEQRHHRAGPAVLQLPGHAVAAKPGTAVQARAQRPAAHKAGASMPRPAPAGGGQQGKGAAAVERASRKNTQDRQAEIMAGDQAVKNLEEMIEQMFKVARRALQSSNATPEQRSVSRTLLQRHDDLAEKRQAHVDAKQARQDARLARRRAVADANTFPVPTDFGSTLLRKVGRPTAKDRAAQAMQEKRQQARLQEQQARALREQTKEATDKAGVAFELATVDFLTQFPHQFPPVKPTAELAPTHDMAPTQPTLDQAVQPPEPVSPGRRPAPPRP